MNRYNHFKYLFLLVLILTLGCYENNTADESGDELNPPLDELVIVKTLNVEIASEDLVNLQNAGVELNIAIRVNNTFDVVWRSISNYGESNNYQWSPIFQVFASNEFTDGVTVQISTNVVNVALGQEVTLDAAGVLGFVSEEGPADSISFINDFGLIHPGLAQQLTDPTGTQAILPIYIAQDIIALGSDVLTPTDEVLVWFEDTETGTMFSDARANSIVVDLTEIVVATIRFSNGEWTTPSAVTMRRR